MQTNQTPQIKMDARLADCPDIVLVTDISSAYFNQRGVVLENDGTFIQVGFNDGAEGHYRPEQLDLIDSPEWHLYED